MRSRGRAAGAPDWWADGSGRGQGAAQPPATCFLAVHSVWEEWGSWSLCSRRCGRGSRSRMRTCVPPQHGGKACEGPELQTKLCSMAACPGQ